MKGKSLKLTLATILLCLFAGINAQELDTTKGPAGIIYKFDIKEEIAPPVWHNTQKAFREAKTMNADIILIHMNTYGGMVETADSIRTAILQSKIPVWVFIDNNAASAGALISIACDSIYMRAGANIGAATVVDQTGKPMPDKYQSYMRSTMRSTAEATGRDPEIAEAMVDPRIRIEGVTDTGRVVTFTTSEAIKHKFCNAQAESIEEILKITGKQDFKVVEQRLTATDRIIGFLTKPIISGLLIMLIIGGVYFELQTPGVGFPLIAAIAGALLYFAPLYIEGLAEHWEILIFILGLILLLVEILAIPGFGVVGISGIILMVAGLTLAMVENIGFDFTGVDGNMILQSFFIVIIASFVAIILSFQVTKKIFGQRTFLGELALHTTQQTTEGYVAADEGYTKMLNQRGIAFTMLRPAGKVEINERIFDAVAESGFIEKGEEVKVVKYENTQLIVRKA